MATQKAKSLTGPEVSKSVTVGIKESTLEALNAAAEVVGAPKNVTVSWGNAPLIQPTDDPDNVYPFQATFTWSESL